jgi:SAM-dependent methyltransferase
MKHKIKYKNEEKKILLKEKEFFSIFSMMERMLRDARRTTVKLESKFVGSYPFIPHYSDPIARTLRYLKALDGAGNLPFYDFGCGYGTKLLLAKLIGIPKAIGIELDSDYVNLFQNSLWNCCDITVTRGNLLELTTNNFVPQTPIIAYYYCPFSDRNLETVFETDLENLLPVGSYLIPCLKQDFTIKKDKRFKQLNCNYTLVFKKVSN